MCNWILWFWVQKLLKMSFRTMQRFYSSVVKRQSAGIIGKMILRFHFSLCNFYYFFQSIINHLIFFSVIGNEILNSRVQDFNSHYICKLLYQCGVSVKKVRHFGCVSNNKCISFYLIISKSIFNTIFNLEWIQVFF